MFENLGLHQHITYSSGPWPQANAGALSSFIEEPRLPHLLRNRLQQVCHRSKWRSFKAMAPLQIFGAVVA